MKKYRIIIAGGRNFDDTYLFESTVSKYIADLFSRHQRENPNNMDFTIEVVSGGASGADSMGEKYASFLGYPVKQFLPNWNLYGRAAGPIRNKQMAEYANEDGNGILIAFWDGKSKGTKSMIELAKIYGLVIHICKY